MSLKKNVIANYVGHGWGAFMSLAFLPFYLKLLGEEAYGLVGIYALLLVWLDLLDMGMSVTLNREIARFTSGAAKPAAIRDLLRSIECVFVFIGVILVTIAFLFADWLSLNWVNAKELSLDTISQAFMIMGFIASLRFIENIYRSSMVGLQKLVIFNVINCIASTMRGLGSVLVLLLIEPSIQVFFIWNGVVAIFSITCFASIVYKNLPKLDRRARFSLDSLSKIRGFAAGILLINILTLIMTQADRIILSLILSLDAFGFYTLAVMCASVTRIAIGPVNEAFYPRFCAQLAANEYDSFLATFHRGTQVLASVLGAIGITIVFFAEPIMHIWTRDDNITEQTFLILAVYTFGNFLRGLFATTIKAQLALGQPIYVIVVNIIILLVMVPLLIWLTPKYGALGAGLIWVGVNIGYFIFAIPVIFKKLLPGQMLTWYVKDILMPIGAVVAVTTVFWLLHSSQWHYLLQVFCIAFSAFLSFVAAVFMSNQLRATALNLLFKIINKGYRG